MTTGVIILILALLALVLMAVEVFIVPGFGISGVGAIVCVVVADFFIYKEFGVWAAFFALLVFGLLAVLMLWWVGKSKTIEKVSLHSTIDSTNATKEQLSVHVGDEGVALTRLALIGNAEIMGKMVEVKSSGKFIEEGTPLVVTYVNEALILVEEKNKL